MPALRKKPRRRRCSFRLTQPVTLDFQRHDFLVFTAADAIVGAQQTRASDCLSLETAFVHQ